MRHPAAAAQQYLSFLGELGRIATGRSELAPDAKDRRFADPAWKESAAYRALAQGYLAWGNALNRFVDEAKLDKRDAERARFVVSLFVDAMAPTNSLAGNPGGAEEAPRHRRREPGARAGEFRRRPRAQWRPAGAGRHPQIRGRQEPRDHAGLGGLPHPGDGADPVPAEASEVHARPLLIAPPQINKFYVFDLAPDKSIVQSRLKGGLQTFAISWKNPTPAESHFGLDTYVAALEEAVDVMRDITGSADVNIWGSCSGGITTSAFLANLAARGERKVHSATVAVCVLDMAVAQDTTAGIFVTPESIVAAKTASQLAGVVEGQELARMFAWMRPNDLIWNYWVNNYLIGNAPPAFDVLYWNNDTTRLPARLHADFLDLIGANPFVNAGRLEVRGTPLDMRRVDWTATSSPA